jgi:subtilisin family serine protease
MIRSKTLCVVVGLCILLGILTYRTSRLQAHDARPASVYTVLLKEGANRDAAIAAVKRAGGVITVENAAIGVLTVTAPASGFVGSVSASSAIAGAAARRPIGRAIADTVLEKITPADVANNPNGASARRPAPTAGMDPLDGGQWGLRMVASDLARRLQAGRRSVLVGILDSGVDGSHPDLTNLNVAFSRNFTQDLPFDELGQMVDGPCEFRGCVDPADWDDSGHGTHMAGLVAAAANGFGLSGVAPNVSLVSVRVMQDSGFVFLDPVVHGLTYAADIGVDVVTLGFSVEPWLYNCTANPADSPDAQTAQRVTINAMARALEYAHRRGVTLIGSLGNNHEDLGNPRTDQRSPSFPIGTSYDRPIDNTTCLQLPAEGPHVIGVAALGPFGGKADYSNYGVERTSISAPGGYFRDAFGTAQFRTNENLVLSTVPRNVVVNEGNVDADGNVTPQGHALGITRFCEGTTCGYYQYLQGTTMAAAHAAGVAALIVSEYGRPDRGNAWTMAPENVRRVLLGTARERPCPVPATIDYLDEGRDETYTATCAGDLTFNGLYGNGIVDANSAVTNGRRFLR